MKYSSTYLYVILACILSSLPLKALNIDHTNDDADSIYINEQEFSKNLVIASYEELVEVYYKAIVAVDTRINNNPYRLMPSNFEDINPFLFDYVILPKFSKPNLTNYKHEAFDTNIYDKTAYQILEEVRKEIAYNRPYLINATLGMLPNPPKIEEASNIYNVDLNFSNLRAFNKITSPKKIEAKKYYKPWHNSIWFMFNMNQTAFSYWSKGGSNSFSISGSIEADADYNSEDKKTQWANDGEIRFGYLQQKGKPFIKNVDYFRLNTQFARNAINRWFYAANAELTSQFFNAYEIDNDNNKEPISSFFAPAYFKLDLGFDYKLSTKKNEKLFSVQASPLSYKLTYVRDTAMVDQKKFGVDADKMMRQEIGGSVSISCEYEYKDKFTGKTRLNLFSNYLNNPQNIDITWNTSITYLISRIFSINFTLDLLYDDDVDILIHEAEDGTKTYGKRLQVKEFLGFGLTYRLM